MTTPVYQNVPQNPLGAAARRVAEVPVRGTVCASGPSGPVPAVPVEV